MIGIRFENEVRLLKLLQLCMHSCTLKKKLERLIRSINRAVAVVAFWGRKNIVFLFHVCSERSFLFELLLADLTLVDVSTFFEMSLQVFKFYLLEENTRIKKDFNSFYVELTDIPHVTFWAEISNVSFEIDTSRFLFEQLIGLLFTQKVHNLIMLLSLQWMVKRRTVFEIFLL